MTHHVYDAVGVNDGIAVVETLRLCLHVDTSLVPRKFSPNQSQLGEGGPEHYSFQCKHPNIANSELVLTDDLSSLNYFTSWLSIKTVKFFVYYNNY